MSPDLLLATAAQADSRTLDALSSVLEAVGDLPNSGGSDAAYQRIAESLREVVPWQTIAIKRFQESGSESIFRSAQGTRDAGEPSRSELVIPLQGRQGGVGVLELGSHRADAFGSEHKHFAQLVARHLGRGIENACAHARATRLARNLSLLQEVGHELTSILDRQCLLERISDILGRLISFQLFSVMAWNEETQQLEKLFSKHLADDILQPQALRLGEGLCGTAASSLRTVRVGNVHIDPRYIPCSDERVRSELVAPLVIEDRLLGVLDLESFEVDAFSEEHEQLLQTLASSIAVALENANLYERLREDEQRLDRDLTTARKVQRFLLPRRSPWVPGLQVGVVNEPARHLGGDIYDFYSYGDKGTAFAIGDVAGKGTGAALYGSLTVGLLRGGYDNRCTPACVMAYLNDELHQLEVERRFLALGFAVYQSDSRKLELSNAGLPYPWLVRGGVAQELRVSGLPLGATHRSERETMTLDLEPGDFVVFTTDGIDEMRDGAGVPFGSERVGELLERCAVSSKAWTAQDLADALMRATDEHLGSAVAGDDRTVLVLKVTG